MDELITILIILAAFISFINKIFKQKKRPQAEQSPPPVAKPDTDEWEFPWLSKEEIETEYPELEEEEPVLEKVTETTHKKFSVSEPKKYEPPLVEQSKVKPVEDVIFQESRVNGLTAFGISLKSPADVKRGIVLAEILGPCRAKKKY